MRKSKTSTGASERSQSVETRLSRASALRFSLYLRRLESLRSGGARTVSSRQLGESLGITDTQVRKDLANLGSLGQPGVGYPLDELVVALRRKLGIDREWAVVVVGIGNLAKALLRYRGFQQQGFRICALVDSDPSKLGQSTEGFVIQPLAKRRDVIVASRAELGLLAVPADAAQDVADRLVQSGVHGILNFAPTVLRLPEHVSLVAVDLAMQLEQLAFLVRGARDG